MRGDLKPASGRSLFRILPVLALLVLGTAGLARAETLDDAARQLAGKISAALAPHEAIALSLRNLSSLTAADVAAVRRALEAELRSRGLRLVEKSPLHKELRVTLAENLEGYVWVAEVSREDASQVTILAVARPSLSSRSSRTSRVVLQSQFFWEQEQPILDLVIQRLGSDAEETMIVLEALRLALYKHRNGTWQLDRTYPLAPTTPVIRDPTGRLQITAKHLALYLNGESYSCGLALPPGAQVECESKKIAWPPPLGQIVEILGKKTPPWFSAASVEDDRQLVTVVAGRDGLTRLYEEGPDPVAAFAGWGSDLASLRTRCGSGSQVLVTGAGDYTVPDSVQAYEIHGRQPAAVSPPVGFPGPIHALETASDGNTVLAVARNLKTGNYEAYRLSISCGR